MTVGGVILLFTCLGLYASGASRAGAVWVCPLAAAMTGVGWTGIRGHRVPRWIYVVLVVCAAALALMGLATLAYGLLHPPVSV